MVRKKKRPAGYLYLVIIAMIIIGAIFFFEWLGGEKPQRLVEKPLELPQQYQEEFDARKAADEASKNEGPGAL